MVEIFRKTTHIPEWYFKTPYKSPVKFHKGEYSVKKTPQKKKPDSNTLAVMQKLREAEQKEDNTKKKKTRKR